MHVMGFSPYQVKPRSVVRVSIVSCFLWGRGFGVEAIGW